MDSSVLDKIYEPFFTTKRSEGSTGLGLHVVHNIIAQTFGGSIRCESAPGRGTTFFMDFPVKIQKSL
jgi:signal transduction histidine kinase